MAPSRHPVAAPVIAGALLLIVLAGFWFTAIYSRPSDESHTHASRLELDKTYILEEKRTEAEQVRGLSGRASLSGSNGMVFIYSTVAERCMWMKEMRFAIDIIWLDSDNRIVRVQNSLAPESYPQTFCANARYVVELPAGTAARNKLAVGQTAALRIQ
ncbi:MAG TPA: DUF192 domain-containing protein [Candidatus Saccharimonadales bacterium]|nr:DUF192 domain-containing protein [Candidatus Saccharimonadales bacterium]